MTDLNNTVILRHSSEEINKFLEEWGLSGKSQITFSKEKGLNYYTFNKWVNDVKKKKGKVREKRSGFTAIEVRGTSPGIFAEIRRDGAMVLLHQVVSAEFLRTLLQ